MDGIEPRNYILLFCVAFGEYNDKGVWVTPEEAMRYRGWSTS